MRESTAPRISKWPFLVGDALLVGLAWLICMNSDAPWGPWQLSASVCSVAFGAWIAVLPFLNEYRAEVKLAESRSLVSVADRFEHLQTVATQISLATGQWQSVRESADKAAAGAKEIAERMAAEVKAFNEFIRRANEDERATLRLEIDKLRRAESEWLQVLVRILDHVYALNQAAVRSRQPGVAEQVGRFQAACHDTARRLGLVPFVPAPSEPLNPERHQLIDPNVKPGDNALVQEAIANGYTFQGKLIRPALVRHQNPAHPPEELAVEHSTSPTVTASGPQPQLPLDSNS